MDRVHRERHPSLLDKQTTPTDERKTQTLEKHRKANDELGRPGLKNQTESLDSGRLEIRRGGPDGRTDAVPGPRGRCEKEAYLTDPRGLGWGTRVDGGDTGKPPLRETR